jgi:hypothetical protein
LGSAGAAGVGGAAADGSKGDGGNNRDSAVAAFMASPAYGHVASTARSTVSATPVVVSGLGVPCQKVTQTIDVGGRNVHASAILCRQADGSWRLNPSQSARAVP